MQVLTLRLIIDEDFHPRAGFPISAIEAYPEVPCHEIKRKLEYQTDEQH